LISDLRGRKVRLIDPVALYLLNRTGPIPLETLRAMTEEIQPGARRQAILQVLAVALALAFVIGGNFVYFRFVSTWKGADPVLLTIYGVQLVVIFGGPFMAYRAARRAYASRIMAVMLRYLHCPYCGYDIHGLPVAPEDSATVCPECGCAWRLKDAGTTGNTADKPERCITK